MVEIRILSWLMTYTSVYVKRLERVLQTLAAKIKNSVASIDIRNLEAF
jgi:hypothetical protein